ncbi:rab-GTPase-TBC domain-containing protein [Calycina marina]|uniref:GTPase-activating protein GYP5 n=1 Tax=Calycina marina TaxID=1763456 RepID=A0A9P8CET6_9HELO|nr:rab-GTPase-TBC domain-containing protein [Calycina marina]
MSEQGEHEETDAKSTHLRKNSTADTSDRENDAFEDANDTAAVASPQEDATRSLTKRRSSSRPRTADQDTAMAPLSPDVETNGEGDHKEDGQETNHPGSILLTERRISTASLADINLEEVTDLNGQLEKTPEAKPTPPPRSTKPTTGLPGALPAVSWGAPPPSVAPQTVNPLPVPAPPTRKLTSPFSWLSRNTAKDTTIVSPPLPSPDTERRNTASSINTLSSNPEMMLSKLEEGYEGEGMNGIRRPVRNSLRDRFKLLRMREEAGITVFGEEEKTGITISGLIGRGSTLGLGLTSPTTATDESNAMSALQSSGLPPSSPNPSINPAMTPGTAQGVFAGPSTMADPASPVDWDLWQNVVNEGPAAVAKTSADELNRAIATGIPNAIRGVVWQVLAQSKNEDLESVYRDLLVRGTAKEVESKNGVSVGTPSSSVKDKEEAQSSASSIHSDHSTPATAIANGMPSPSPAKDRDPEATMKAHMASLAEKKKKAKEDEAALKKLEKAIKRDLGARTSFSKFASSAGLQEGLFGVCKAYALFDEGVGYAQGINFIAMPLLFNMSEEEAFCLLVRLMNQFHLRDLFIQDMPGLHMHLYQFERLLEDLEPSLYCHLHRKQVSPHLYATQWFLTLFAYRFPLQLVLRIYDLILSEGLSAILKFGIVLMQKNAAALLAMTDMVALTTFLKDKLFDVYIDQAPSAGSILEHGFFGNAGASIDKEVYRADQMVNDACAVKITPQILDAYKAEWEEKTRIERETQSTLESLKTNSASLQQKVHRLEKRVEDHDTEHAALATELVRTKVENEELKDGNESLSGQIVELRKVIETQPEEVEARLKSEMDRLLKRNQEVHEENSRLEEEMADMEKSLVETKMMYAEVFCPCYSRSLQPFPLRIKV